VRQLLDLGVSPEAPFTEGDGYFGVPKDSLPIHVAAWRARTSGVAPHILQAGSRSSMALS